ncbi:MAG TPA: hypothetical protein PKA95_10765 [Thermomicrobiales bacterium]|nr:hypothetical protein [Thermomicrobiales bacterium]
MSTNAPDEQPDDRATGDLPSAAGERRSMEKDDFLVPGPTPESNEGLARWGITWLVFSLLLMLVMLGITVVCYFIGAWLNLG